MCGPLSHAKTRCQKPDFSCQTFTAMPPMKNDCLGSSFCEHRLLISRPAHLPQKKCTRLKFFHAVFTFPICMLPFFDLLFSAGCQGEAPWDGLLHNGRLRYAYLAINRNSHFLGSGIFNCPEWTGQFPEVTFFKYQTRVSSFLVL